MASKKSKQKAKPKQAIRAPAAKRKSGASRGPRVSHYMSRSLHTIGRDQSLDRAHELMNKHGIRHLPVLDGGELVGVLSQRDLYFVEMLDTTPRAEIKVEEAMSQDVFETTSDASLSAVAASMLRQKLGCAVVKDGGKVTGVFSTTDALRALCDHLPAG